MLIKFKAVTMSEYHSLGLDLLKPGIYDVPEHKAKQLLEDFPKDFVIPKKREIEEFEGRNIEQPSEEPQ